MHISADQCRAARSLLNWTQDELATNAKVSRATIVDFESNSRQPMKNNVRAIAHSMFAGGIEFIPEEGDAGVGVRFRKRKLEYINNINLDFFNRVATIKMRYASQEFLCVISLEAVDDIHRTSLKSDDEVARAISDILPTVLTTAEHYAPTHIKDGRLNLTYDMLGGT